jgi:uncharacterized membrane protein YqjE
VIKESLLKFLRLDGILANLTGYVEARIELMKLEVKEDITKALSKAALIMLIAFILTLFILFISMAIAYKISDATNPFTGFSIVAGFYLLVGVALWFSRSTILKKLEEQFNVNTKFKKK